MLKRKLYKVGLVMSSLIPMAASSGSQTNSQQPAIDTMVINTVVLPLLDSSVAAKAPEIQLNKSVSSFVKEYIKKNGYFLGKTKNRTARYFTIMDSVFEQHEMPVQLKYLSFVESGLKHNLISKSGAVGPWAFMPVAAKEYGLRISGKNDERLDYYKSTVAAAGLLTDLFDKYGDWLLVIAAYNCGPGGVQKAIKKSGSRNYWALQQFLPDETRKHVKKFIAVHYYFEGTGSVATMTKTEAEKHTKAVELFVSKQQETPKTDSLSVMVVK